MSWRTKNMLSLQNNLLAINANNHLQINSNKTSRTTEKLSSGYRINRAADDAAGLAISEKMRRQIRGLMQGTANARDGVSFVQVADGAMDEVHDMLQRMNELAIQSLNGTWTEGDRAAMNAEFDQLRTEIDRIDHETQYNEQPVFEEHESSYYQIIGNRRWNDNQLHTVPSMNNELNIHLPANYEPCDYTLTVPGGIYTTQELIDEIDSALEKMTPPNPGFVLEYTETGICKLNFERADGMPTEIASVDGSLSYLLFDCYNGGASSGLLGTTVFSAEFPLTIARGQNDQLTFYVEGSPDPISVTIPPGEYYRSDMIRKINEVLSRQPAAAGITAKEYGDSCIQITGGITTSITGLKGNMFKVDPQNATIKYSSVFYDNLKYGVSSGTAAYVSGRAYYGANVTDKIHLSSSNQNNVLRFKLNGETQWTEVTFADKAGGYTMSEIQNTINTQLKDKAVSAGLGSSTVYVPTSPTGSSPRSVQYLTLTSSLRGSGSSLEFDTTDPVAVNTYNALFRDTHYLPYRFSGTRAQLSGHAKLDGNITLANDASLTFKVNGQNYTIDNIGGSYTNCQTLVSQLNSYIQTAPAFSAIANKINFDTSSGYLYIKAKTDDIQKIEFDAGQTNATYKQLFVGTTTSANSPGTSYSYGEVKQKEGDTGARTDRPATAYASFSKHNDPITITNSTNKLSFSTSEGTKTVTLATGTYGMDRIVSQINAQLKPSGNSGFASINVSYANNRLTLTATSNMKKLGDYYISFSGGSAWSAILGTTTSDYPPTVREAIPNLLSSYNAIPDEIKLDGSNNELTLHIGNDSATINIATTPSPHNRDSLKNAIQTAINNNSTLKDKVTVNIASDGKLQFNSSGGAITASGSFNDHVIITQGTLKETTQKGQYSGFEKAYIIGRKDLTTEPIDIVSGSNDTFTFDFTYPKDGKKTMETISVTIPEGTYTGYEVADVLKKEVQSIFNQKFEDLEIDVTIGGEKTDVIGANDDTALQLSVNIKAGKEPEAGEYILDGIRGSAAGFLFYKTTINPNATYITGSKNLSKGVLFKPGQNVFTFSADSVPYKYTFPENIKYTGQEFVDLLNDMFKNGDDNGNPAPLTASLENGFLKIAHKALGTHTITNVGGSARGTLFLEESGRRFRDPLYILVGVETKDIIEIPRTRVGSCSLAINSITISRPKYAEKAVKRIKEAITLLSSRRSTYGSIQNRLEHTINNNNNVIENTQAGESAIRDADIATEVMEHSINNLLMQSSLAMLAQANQQPRIAMNLLQF